MHLQPTLTDYFGWQTVTTMVPFHVQVCWHSPSARFTVLACSNLSPIAVAAAPEQNSFASSAVRAALAAEKAPWCWGHPRRLSCHGLACACARPLSRHVARALLLWPRRRQSTNRQQRRRRN
eukprot:SAG11_NODE_6443_length_1312_cov_1.593570_1_plen_121_part_10